MGIAKQPPRSLSVHAQCFWTFTAKERRIMRTALDAYMQDKNIYSVELRVAITLRDALNELSEQD